MNLPVPEPGAWVSAQLDAVRAADRWRTCRVFDANGPAGIRDGDALVSFAGNDYLGLSTHPAVVGAATAALARWGAGATASRLVVGHRPVHEELEQALASWKGTEAALVFPTGYAANLGTLATLGGPDCLIVSDERNHASIIDGCRLSRSPVTVVGHHDVDAVETALRERSTPRAIVVVDAVYSMDGDVAPLAVLAEVTARHGAFLVVDDAHLVFDHPAAVVDALAADHVVRVVTLSKALGALGGAVCATRAIVDLLVNRARPFVFTTALSPADAAASRAAVGITTSPEGDDRRARLRRLVDRVAPGAPSPIIPIIVGAEADALAAADALADRGLLVPAIRPPTVAPNTSRLRVTLSATHTDAMVDELVAGLVELDLLPTEWSHP